MTTDQFNQLRRVFDAARDEASNDEGLSDWLINLGGSLIALGVNLQLEDDDEEEQEDWKSA
jgi:hypothetical protein